MGVFDYLRCLYPLPVPGATTLEYQTKDTPAQFCDHYEIREDGTLWFHDYDLQDQSKRGQWMRENPERPVPEELNSMENAFFGCMGRINERWAPVDFRGEIVFYGSFLRDGDTIKEANWSKGAGWLEWSAYFVDGKLTHLQKLEHTEPTV